MNLDDLACPACGGRLTSMQGTLRCRRDRIDFPVRANVPDLVPPHEREPVEAAKREFSAWWSSMRSHHDTQRLEAQTGLLRAAREQLPRGARVLEIGAGDGRFSVALEDGGFDVTALDLVPVPVVGAASIVATLDALPLAAARFDGVFACAALSYAREPTETLRQIHRALVPRGRLFIALTPVHRDARSARKAEASARARFRRASPAGPLGAHYHHFTTDELRGALSEAGFVAVDVQPIPFGIGFRFVRSLKRVLLRMDLARFPLIVARKGA